MNEMNQNIRFLSALSYISILFIIAHFAVEKDNPDLRFHKIQGFVLFCFSVFMYLIDYLIYLLFSFEPRLQSIITVLLTIGISVGYLLLMAIGISGAVKFEQRLLPFIGNISVQLRSALNQKFRHH